MVDNIPKDCPATGEIRMNSGTVFAYTDVAGECAPKPSPDGFGETAADGLLGPP